MLLALFLKHFKQRILINIVVDKPHKHKASPQILTYPTKTVPLSPCMFVRKLCRISFSTTLHPHPPPTGSVSGTEQLGAINFELRGLSYCMCVCVCESVCV